MTQLTYNEAFDPYHATFRFVRLWKGCAIEEVIHFDMLRILDFYLLFPFRLQNMSFYSADRAWRAISKSYEHLKPYGDLPDDASLLSKMEPFQRAAVTSLVKAKVISHEAWHQNQIEFLDVPISDELADRCKEANESMNDIVKIICELKARYPLLGRNGLKDRTGLLEFRYDSV